jgi:hypothetical protein
MVQKRDLQDNTLPITNKNTSDTFLCSYTVASAEMRYIEICKRDIYLRRDYESNPILRGEISDCGSGSAVDLNQILLEYSVSCEGCKKQEISEDAVITFGEQLGKILVDTLYKDKTDIPTIEKISTTFKCVLDSMTMPYTVASASDTLQFNLSGCPIRETAKKNGLTRGIAMAHRSFIALCTCIIQNISPHWVMLNSTEADIENPLHEIVISRLI